MASPSDRLHLHGEMHPLVPRFVHTDLFKSLNVGFGMDEGLARCWGGEFCAENANSCSSICSNGLNCVHVLISMKLLSKQYISIIRGSPTEEVDLFYGERNEFWFEVGSLNI